MSKIGLIAGGGSLPIEFIRSVKEKGDTVVVFALKGMASEQIESEAEHVYRLDIGQYAKFAMLLLKERIRSLAMLGKVRKNVIYEGKTHDETSQQMMGNLKNKKDYTILQNISENLKKIGVEVIDSTQYLKHLLPEAGVLNQIKPDSRVEADIEFGADIAKKIADMDIGQTIIVKDRSVVAVEAMEGTDATIARAKEVAGDGCVAIKVSRSHQDPRWDIPTVGPNTLKGLIENKFRALAIESSTMFIVDKEEMIQKADAAGITLVAV